MSLRKELRCSRKADKRKMGRKYRQVKSKKYFKIDDESGSYTDEDSAYVSVKQPRCKKKYLLIAVIVIAILVYLVLGNDVQQYGSRAIDNLAVSFKWHIPIYIVVIDAGSTASRVNAFTLHYSVVTSQLFLDDTLFYETKPGLTSYAKNPKDVEGSLKILLDKAKSRIPPSQWAVTPLILRATAGLRLLKDTEAQNILLECKRVLDSSGFKVLDDSVAIMNGSDEGIFSWFTTNFILKKFSKYNNDEDFAKNTVAALDLGGGSTQVTFALPPDSFKKQPGKFAAHEKNIYQVNVFNTNMSVFTESFLGLGLMAARKEILSHPDNYLNQDETYQENSTNNVLRAECVNPIISGAEWSYGGIDYIVKGPLNGSERIMSIQYVTDTVEHRPIVRFNDCLNIIKKVVDAAIPHKIPSFRGHDIYAFSYYFERATEAGLIDPFRGGMVTFESIFKTASEVCAYPNVDQPFMCLDLSFIFILLRDGFGLDWSSKIFMHKYIDGHQLNWALGAAFNILQKHL